MKKMYKKNPYVSWKKKFYTIEFPAEYINHEKIHWKNSLLASHDVDQ